MSPGGAIFVSFPLKTGTNLRHSPPPIVERGHWETRLNLVKSFRFYGLSSHLINNVLTISPPDWVDALLYQVLVIILIIIVIIILIIILI